MPPQASRRSSGARPALHSTTLDLGPGDLIGQKYRLVRQLGQGGMAAVWVAHNEALDIHVAVKFIRGDLRHPQLADRLLQEARAAARIGHPAIVRVTDFGKTKPGHPYIVMELLNGEDLGTLLDREQRMDAVQAVRTLLPIIDALAAAHEQGIVHRDLKPENIFLTRERDQVIRPKLVDFGIAKLDREDFKRLTDFGVALGSPGYMSPEQARGEDADLRADIWALCVVLYELITGVLPFDGDSYNGLLRAVIEQEARPVVEFAAGDAGLWAVLERGFVKAPDGRWQSMRDLGVALAGWLVERGYAADITGRSLQTTWLERRPSSGENLLAAPPPRTPPNGQASLGPPTLRPVADDATPAPTPIDPTPVNGASGKAQRSRSPLLGVAVAAVVGSALAVAAFALLRHEPTREPRRAASASASATLAASAPSPAASPSIRQSVPRPALSAADSARPEAGAPASSSTAAPPPVRKHHPPRRHYEPVHHRSGGLDIKTTL